MIDEESLREIVSDIVRKELQGSLGERITRNVRKLVRREIYRALEARDLG
jgi:cell pole-organizing protein PopZ